jgi:predicted secreted hydrolase
MGTKWACHLALAVVFVPLAALGCQQRLPDAEARRESLVAPAVEPASRGDRQNGDDWAKAVGPRRFRFPQDHGAHEDYRIEWWYYTGNLETPTGRRFGYQLTFFRTGVQKEPENPSRWAVRDLYTAHFAISDIENRKHYFWQRNRRAGIEQAGAETGRLNVFSGDWKAEMRGDTHELVAGSDDYRIRLQLRPGKSLVLQGDNGLSRKGELVGNASYYYSFPRLKTSGIITVDGVSHEVRGDSWMDHEFSTSLLEEGQLGWDWFSIQLSNNTELMLYQMRRSDGTIDPCSSGTFVAQDGHCTPLTVSDFHMQPTSAWRSNRTGAEYPLRWRIKIPKLGIDLNVEPAFEEQEMVTEATTGIAYWEGSIAIAAVQGQNQLRGVGYLELTGYSGRGLGTLLGD